MNERFVAVSTVTGSRICGCFLSRDVISVVVVVVVVVLYWPNTNRYITDTCKTNNSIKHIWQVAREALVLSQLATYQSHEGMATDDECNLEHFSQILAQLGAETGLLSSTKIVSTQCHTEEAKPTTEQRTPVPSSRRRLPL